MEKDSILYKIVEYYVENRTGVSEWKGNLALEEKQNIREIVINSFIDDIKSDIEDELSEEAKNKIIKIENETRKRIKIAEIKKIVWHGFILSFFVGLLVNQITEVISLCKGTVSDINTFVTAVIILSLVLICLGLFIYDFLVQIINMIKEPMNKNE